MTIAYIAGNGESRRSICLHTVKSKGKLFGCNAIHKEITPDVLVAADSNQALAIQKTGYGLDNEFHTRKPFAYSGAIKLKQPYANWSSGANAVQIAVLQGHTEIYLFGFDFGSTHNKLNNIYAGLEFYGKPNDPAVPGEDWIHQILTIIKHNKKISFKIVAGLETNSVESFKEFKNVEILSISEFLKHINNV